MDCQDKRRRQLLLGALALAVSQPLQARSALVRARSRIRTSASVLDFIPKAEIPGIVAGTSRYDATEAFHAALRLRPRVYVPAGTYLIESLSLPSNVEIFGEGDASVIRPKSARSAAAIRCNSGSAVVADNVRGVRLDGLRFKGWVDSAGFAEHCHLLSISGITELTLERVSFEGWSGDALYLGSGEAGQERHNRQIAVVDCEFNGLNNDNRNAISAIDIDGLLVSGCRFTNCTRPNMPGPIDLEPNNHPWHIVRNVTIRGNVFRHCGGMGAQISCYQPAVVRKLPSRLTVEGNRFEDYIGTGADVAFRIRRDVTASDEASDLRVIKNHGSRGFRPLRLYSGRGVVVADNTFEDYAANAQVGYLDPTDRVHNVLIEHNRFLRCGKTAAGRYGLSVFKADHLVIADNEFADCGDGLQGAAAIQLDRGSSSYLEIANNIIESPSQRTRKALVIEKAHATDSKTNRLVGNVVGENIAPIDLNSLGLE